MSISWTVTGAEGLARDLELTSTTAARAVRQVVKKTAIDITALGRVKAPVRTGLLRSSIGTDIAESADGIETHSGPLASYADYVESGTYKMAPRPYMAPAADELLPVMLTAIEQVKIL